MHDPEQQPGPPGPEPNEPTGARSVTKLSDPRALRALAHPIRLALVGMLRQEGPLTATRAAALLGESSASGPSWRSIPTSASLIGRNREKPILCVTVLPSDWTILRKAIFPSFSSRYEKTSRRRG